MGKQKIRKNFILIVTLICGYIFFPSFVFANSGQENTLLIGEYILKFLSWLRVVPAVIAGELMTNSFVYGEVMGLTVYLWKMWTIMRTMANYTLGFLFLGYILKQFFVQDDMKKLFDVVKKTFIAAILIQMSWFLMAVLVDFSIVATTAVASLPNQIMQKNFEKLKYKIGTPKIINIKAGAISSEESQNAGNNIKYIDDVKYLLPTTTTVSGPLLFMGASVLGFFEFHYVGSDVNDGNTEASWNLGKLTLGAVMKILVLIMVITPMVVLMIVNIVRIFRIRIRVIASPFIILNHLFKFTEAGEKFTFSAVIGLVFQPVAVVGMLSLGMILIIGVYDALQGDTDFKRGSLEHMNIYIDEDDTTRVGGPTSEVSIVGNIFSKSGQVGGFIGSMILTFFVIFLLRGLIKVGFSTSKITQTIVDGMYKFASDGMKLAPIPIPGLGGVSISSLTHGYEENKGTIKNFIDMKDGQAAEKLIERFHPGYYKDKLTSSNVSALKDIVISNPYSGNRNIKQAKAFWDEAYKLTKIKKKISYSGEFKGAINYRLNKGGLQYLGDIGIIKKGISNVAELSKKENKSHYINVKKYIDVMMKNGFGSGVSQQRNIINGGRGNISTINRGKIS